MAINGDIFVRTVCLLTAFAYITSQSAKLGEVILAANSVLDQFGMLAAFLLDGFANATEALVGEAFGAKDRSALRRYIGAACAAAGVVASLVSLAWGVGGEWLISVLTTIPEVRTKAAEYLGYVVVAPLVSVWAFMLDGIFIGAVATPEMRNAMLVMLLLTVGVGEALINTLSLGNTGLWCTYMFLMVVRTLGLGCYLPRLVRRCN
jgi:MATE family multidrug resistance protein